MVVECESTVDTLYQETGRTASGSFMRTHAHPLNSTAITAPPPAVSTIGHWIMARLVILQYFSRLKRL